MTKVKCYVSVQVTYLLDMTISIVLPLVDSLVAIQPEHKRFGDFQKLDKELLLEELTRMPVLTRFPTGTSTVSLKPLNS